MAYLPGSLILGAVIGFLSGLLGKGGSAVCTPALRVFLGVPEYWALASPLPATVPITLAAAWAYRHQGLLNRAALLASLIIGVPATVAGSYASHWAGGKALMVLTALFVSGLGLSLLQHKDKEETEAGGGALLNWKDPRLLGLNLFVGFLSGLLANSGGIFFAPLYMEWLGLPVKSALASSLGAACILAMPGTLAHWQLGHVNWALAGALSATAIPAAYLGAKTAQHLRSVLLLRLYGLALLGFGVFDLIREIR